MPEDREGLRRTFDSVADRYERARPTYPEALYDELAHLADLRPGDRLLEVGCGTGQATVPLARRGFQITCVELGHELAAVARRQLEPFPEVRVVEAPFEEWASAPAEAFDLVYAAAAWRWLDPEVRYPRSWELLRPGGHLAFWSATHVFPEGGDPFFREIQEEYEEIGEGLPPDASWPQPGELPDDRAELEATGLFEYVAVRHFDWEIVYDTDGYLDLLDTFSGHIAMAPWQRDRLHGEIRRRLAKRPDGRVRRHWGAVLHVARRRG